MRPMKRILSALGFVALASLPAAALTLTPQSTEVVVAPDAPKTVLYAADEMTNALSRAFGRAVPVVTAPTAGKTPVFLGENEWSRRAGIDVQSLARDAFVIACDGKAVYVAGRDDPSADLYVAVSSPRHGVWSLYHERATLFGVYEFLERAAKARFYFPGELGTIVPRQGEIRVKKGRGVSAPAFSVRNYSWYSDGEYFEGTNRSLQTLAERKVNYLRNRMQTQYVPCCHGSNGFNVQRRFGATHPEYLALVEKGGRLVRDVDPNEKAYHPGQLCHSSAVYDELFRDICSYARGEPPSVRNMRAGLKGAAAAGRWNIMTFRRPWVDVMPQDGFVPCRCEACQAAYRKGDAHYATELVWGRTVELARRVKAAGLDGIRITQMAYPPYRRIPGFEIPDNVDVMVAESGPWSVRSAESLASEFAEIRGWREKLGRPVWAWTYVNKFGTMNLPTVPCGAPRAWGEYYRAIAPWVFGVFAQSDSDRAFYNYLCYYVFGKVCWNPEVDVDALLDEYFRLMFGPAAREMAAFVDDVEDLWVGRVCGRTVATALGPQRIVPSPYDLYMRIYTQDVLSRWDGLLASAAKKVAPGSLEARRIALYRRECYEPLAATARDYRDAISVGRALADRAANPGRANLLVNGDFSRTTPGKGRFFGVWEGSDWRGGWYAQKDGERRVSFRRDVPKGASGLSATLECDGKGCVTLVNDFEKAHGRLRPGKRYRLSLFARLTDVAPTARGGGAGVRVWCDHNSWFPKNFLTGTTDWIHQSFEFTAGPKSQDFHSQVELRLWNATGAASFADLRLEEVD